MRRFDFLRDGRPEFVERLRPDKLPRQWRDVVMASFAVACMLAAAYGIERVRLSEARGVEQRARVRLDRAQAELDRARLEWRAIDLLVRQDRTLRRIRLSGPRAAARLAHVGNILPNGVWLDAFAASQTDPVLRGHARDLGALASALGKLLADRAAGEPRIIRIARDGAQSGAPLGFEVRLESTP